MKTLNFQSIAKSTKKSTMWITAAALALTVSFTSCNKDKNLAPDLTLQSDQAPLPSSGSTVNLSTSAAIQGTITNVPLAAGAPAHYKVTNFFVDQGITSHPDSIYHRPNGSYFFDLSTGNVKTVSDVTTPNNFDLEFTGTGNGYIKRHSTVNVKAIDKAFNSVVLADWTTSTSTHDVNTFVSLTGTGSGYGHDNLQMTGSTPVYTDSSPLDKKGWFNYFFANHQVLPIPNRTILIQDSQGNIFAFEFQSVYQNSTPAAIPPSTFPNNYSYLNFRFKKLN